MAHLSPDELCSPLLTSRHADFLKYVSDGNGIVWIMFIDYEKIFEEHLAKLVSLLKKGGNEIRYVPYN